MVKAIYRLSQESGLMGMGILNSIRYGYLLPGQIGSIEGIQLKTFQSWAVRSAIWATMLVFFFFFFLI